MSPFDIAKHLNTKTNLEKGEVLAVYNAWIVDLVLSGHQQTVLFANEMNKYDLTKEQQYDFYFNGIPKGSRFAPWNKKESQCSPDDLEIVMSLFDINKKTAERYLSLLSDEQLTIIRTLKGGNHDKRRSTN